MKFESNKANKNNLSGKYGCSKQSRMTKIQYVALSKAMGLYHG